MSGNTGIIKIALQMDDKGTIKVLKTTGTESDKAGKKGKKAFNDMDKSSRKFTAGARGVNIALLKIGAGIAAIGGGLGAVELVQFGKDVVMVGVQFDSLGRSYKAIFGSVEAARNELGFVNDLAKEFGMYLPVVEDAFKNISAAAKGTVLEGEAVRKIFKAITGTSAALGMSADDTQGALRALSQMISKGNVQAEELRGQLGERLPGAFQLAAKAMGVTTQELNKMLELGEVAATDLLPKLADVLTEQYGKAAVSAGTSSRAAFVGFKNSVRELKITLANSGITEFFADLARSSTHVINQLNGFIKQDSFETKLVNMGKGIETQINMLERLGASSLKTNKRYQQLVNTMQAIKNIQEDTYLDYGKSTDGLAPKKSDIDLKALQELTRKKYAYIIANAKKLEKDTWLIKQEGYKRAAKASQTHLIPALKEEIELEKQYQEEFMKRVKKMKDSWQLRDEGFKRAGDAALEMNGIEEYTNKKTQITEKMFSDLKFASDDYYALRKSQIRSEYEEMEQYTGDQVNAYRWYKQQIKELDEELNLSRQTEFQKSLTLMKDGIIDYSSTFSNQLNEMAWGADVSFKSIARSFTKMLTEMAMQKMAIEPMFKSMFGESGSSGGSGWLGTAIGIGVNAIGGMFGGGAGPTTLSNGAIINTSGAVYRMADGGVINEHVVGTGLSSGKSYEFGEGGVPEAIIPQKNWGTKESSERSEQRPMIVHQKFIISNEAAKNITRQSQRQIFGAARRGLNGARNVA